MNTNPDAITDAERMLARRQHRKQTRTIAPGQFEDFCGDCQTQWWPCLPARLLRENDALHEQVDHLLRENAVQAKALAAMTEERDERLRERNRIARESADKIDHSIDYAALQSLRIEVEVTGSHLDDLGVSYESGEGLIERIDRIVAERDALCAEVAWLGVHCAFVADGENLLGPFRVGELRCLAQAGIAAERGRGEA